MVTLLFNSFFNKIIPRMKAKISEITALHSNVTTLCDIVAIIIIAGTKNITSLDKASKVEEKLEPIDCKMIDMDLTSQVRIIPPKKIFKQ